MQYTDVVEIALEKTNTRGTREWRSLQVAYNKIAEKSLYDAGPLLSNATSVRAHAHARTASKP